MRAYPRPQVAVIRYSIHTEELPRPLRRSVKTENGALNGFILGKQLMLWSLLDALSKESAVGKQDTWSYLNLSDRDFKFPNLWGTKTTVTAPKKENTINYE